MGSYKSQRVEWTRGWLNAFASQNGSTTPSLDDDEEYDVLRIDDALDSDCGVQSLSESSGATDRLSSDGENTGIERSACLDAIPSDWEIQSLVEYCDTTEGWSSNGDRRSQVREDSIQSCDPSDCCELCHWLRNGGSWSTYSWAQRAIYQGLDPSTSEGLDRKAANNYELCGRRDASFRDLRSASQARKRQRSEQEKYYNWKRVKPGWLGQKVRNICDIDTYGCYCLGNPIMSEEPFTVTKKMMYEEAKWYPRPPTYHRSTKKPYLRAWHSRIGRVKKEGKHAREYLLEGLDDDRDRYVECIGFHEGDDYRAWLDDHCWEKQANWSGREVKVDEIELTSHGASADVAVGSGESSGDELRPLFLDEAVLDHGSIRGVHGP